MKYLFWILWLSEFIFMIWMLLDELKLKYLPMPPYIPIGFLWLAIAIVVKLVIKSDILALVMVVITGLPLAFMGGMLILMLIIEFINGPIRWN